MDPIFPHADNKCRVCDSTIGPAVGLGRPGRTEICNSFDCQRIWKLKATSNPYLFENQVQFHRKLLQARKKSAELYRQQMEEKRQREEREDKEIRAAVIAETKRGGNDTPQAHLPTIPLPSGPREVVNLSKKRISSYERHLYKLISQAFSSSAASATEDTAAKLAMEHTSGRYEVMEHKIRKFPELDQLNDQFCGTCKGGCCVTGNDQAYLSVDTILRVRKQNPGIRPLQILNTYLSSLASKVMKGSCINHTTEGCVLEREYRSDSCNRFYCGMLHSYAEEYGDTPTTASGALVINRKQNLWGRAQPGENPVLSVSVVEPNRTRLINLESGKIKATLAVQMSADVT